MADSTVSEAQDGTEEEMEEGFDASTSTEPELSEEKNGGFEAVLDTETRIPPEVSQQEGIGMGLSPTKELTALQEAPEKEGKEEEKAPVPSLAVEKEPVVPQAPEEQEPVFPQSVLEKEEAIPLPPEQEPSVPQSLTENEEKIPQLSSEKEPSTPQSPLEMEPLVPQPTPEKEQKVPQLPLETEPSVPQPTPEEEQKLPQLPLEAEPSVPQPTPEKEQKIPQLPLETEPSVPQPTPQEQKVSQLPLETEPSVSQTTPEKERKVTQLPLEAEPSVPQPTPEKEQKVPQLPLETEPSVLQTTPEKERKVPQLPLETEPSVLQTTPEKEWKVPQLPLEMEPSVPHPQLKREPPVHHPRIFGGPPLPQTPAETEPPVPHPLVLKEPPASPPPPVWEPIAPRQPAIKELLQSFPEKSVALKEQVALRRKSPYKSERLAFQEEREAVIRSETKAWPGRVDTSSSVLANAKPKPSAEPLGGKAATLNDTMEDLASHLRQVGHASKSAMASSISTFMGSPVGEVFARTIDRALEKSEEWLDYYLPVQETDVAAAEEEYATASEDLCKEGCLERISSLSTKMRNRAFRLALHQLKTSRQSASENLPVLDQMLDVLDRNRGQNILNVSSIPESLRKLWGQWGAKQELPKSSKMSSRSVQESPSIVPEQLELKALDLTRNLAQQLYGTYHDLLPHVADLPSHLQEKAIRVHENMEELQSRFASSRSLRDLPSSFVLHSRQKMVVARENLDEILDFLTQNSAMNWLSQPTSSTRGKQSTSAPAQRQSKARSPDGKAREAGSFSQAPPSSPHL